MNKKMPGVDNSQSLLNAVIAGELSEAERLLLKGESVNCVDSQVTMRNLSLQSP